MVIQATAARAWQLVLLSAPDYRTLDPLVRAKHVLLTLLAAMLMAACETGHGFRARPRALAEPLKAAHTGAGVRCSHVGIVVSVMCSRRIRLLALLVAVLGAAVPQTVLAQTQTQTAVTPYPLTSGLPIVGDPRDARANNLVVLDSIVFVLGSAFSEAS